MCVHVFSHLDAANWILDHAAWDSWHPPLPEPVGPEPRAPAPPNILREPCEAENLGVCFFFQEDIVFWWNPYESYDSKRWFTWLGVFRSKNHSSAVGWYWIYWAGWHWQLSHLWWAAVHIHGLLLLVAEHHASQGIPRHRKTGWSRSRGTIHWVSSAGNIDMVKLYLTFKVHMGSYGFMFFMFFMFFGSRFPPVLVNRTWLESVAFGKREAFG